MNIIQFKHIILTIAIGLFLSVSAEADTIQYKIYNFAPIDAGFDTVAERLLEYEFCRKESATQATLARQLKNIAEKAGNSQLKARAIFWNVRANQLSANPDSCIIQLEKARTMTATEYDYDLACISYQLAGNYERLGHYFNTYQLLEQAIPIFEKYNDYYFLGNAHLLMGLTYNEIKEKELAMDEIKTAGEYYSKVGYPLNRIYFFQAMLSENQQESIRLYGKSIELGQNDPGMSIQAYINISNHQLALGNYEEAMKSLESGRQMRITHADGNMLLELLLLLHEGLVYYHTNDYQKALDTLLKMERATIHYPGERWESEMYLYLSRSYEAIGNREKAFEYLKKHQAAFKTQVSEVEQQEIPKARARDAINRQKDTIKLLEQKAELHQNRVYMMILIIVVIVIVIIAVAFYVAQRIKIHKIKNRELHYSLEQEIIIARLNRENFERDIQQKDCEISSSVLLLANKNDVLQQINSITRSYADEGKIPAEYVKQINAVVNDSLKSDDEWSRFKVHFDSVHPAFFSKLKEQSEELTENDLRLCAYIRIGLKAKQIAEMLSVSPASVNSNRYRLRKKLGLQKDDSLDDFIRKV